MRMKIQPPEPQSDIDQYQQTKHTGDTVVQVNLKGRPCVHRAACDILQAACSVSNTHLFSAVADLPDSDSYPIKCTSWNPEKQRA